jgi:hypothetical protein
VKFLGSLVENLGSESKYRFRADPRSFPTVACSGGFEPQKNASN